MQTQLVAECKLKIEFYDVDAMNVVWHGNYPRYLEQARSALLDLIDYNYLAMHDSGYLWPVIDLRIKYILPITLHQSIIVQAKLVEYQNRMKIDYTILDATSATVLTKASSIQVAVKANNAHLEMETPELFQAKVRGSR